MASELMPIDLEALVTVLEKSVERAFFVQIGAGSTTQDPLFELAVKHGWRGLLVEPVSDLFEQLIQDYAGVSGLRFENCAISGSNGEATLYRVPLTQVTSGHFKDWAAGVGTLYRSRNALGGKKISELEYSRLKPHIIRDKVRTMTLAELFKKHNVRSIDLMKIEAEGGEYEIFKQIPLKTLRPQILQINHSYLTPGEISKILKALFDVQYTIKTNHRHILATTLI